MNTTATPAAEEGLPIDKDRPDELAAIWKFLHPDFRECPYEIEQAISILTLIEYAGRLEDAWANWDLREAIEYLANDAADGLRQFKREIVKADVTIQQARRKAA